MRMRNEWAFLRALGWIALSLAICGCGGEAAMSGAPGALPPGEGAAAPAPAPSPPGEPGVSGPGADPAKAQPAGAGAVPTAPAGPPAAPSTAAGPAPAAPSPIIPGVGSTTLEDGTKITVTKDDTVTIEDSQGKLSGESSFGANGFSYRKSVEFMLDLQQRIKAGDREKVAGLILFPLRVNQSAGKHRVIKDRAAFLRDFDQIVTPKVSTEILAADARKLFSKSQGVMLGSGIVWAGIDPKGNYGLITINQ